MKTKQQYLKECKRRNLKTHRDYKRNYAKEIDEMDMNTLKWKLLIYMNRGLSIGSNYIIGWEYIREECRFCDVEYIEGKYNKCCDNCFEENKNKTLEELVE